MRTTVELSDQKPNGTDAADKDATPDVSDIPETNFRRGVRNPYLVLLAPDVWALFPTAEKVNAALRAYAKEHGLDRETRPTHGEVLRQLMSKR